MDGQRCPARFLCQAESFAEECSCYQDHTVESHPDKGSHSALFFRPAVHRPNVCHLFAVISNAANALALALATIMRFQHGCFIVLKCTTTPDLGQSFLQDHYWSMVVP